MRLFITTLLAFGLVGVTPLTAKASNCGYASFYGINDGYNGQLTANGEIFNTYSFTAAHRWLPFGTRLRVYNPRNGRSAIVRINDRGPYHGNRDLDLSYAAFKRLGNPSAGVIRVCW